MKTLGRTLDPAKGKASSARKEQRNWYKDRYQRVTVQRNLLLLVTFVALGGVLLSSVAISQLTPLKSVEPFVIQVEDKTGVTQVVDPVQAKELTANEAVNRYFINRYIVARESFDKVTLEDMRNTVRVMSAQLLYSQYRLLVDPTKTDSRYNKFIFGGRRSVRIKSISFLGSPDVRGVQTAQARITVIEHAANDNETQANQIVTLTFQYAKFPLTTEERYINPLGFLVTTYRIDDEVIQ